MLRLTRARRGSLSLLLLILSFITNSKGEIYTPCNQTVYVAPGKVVVFELSEIDFAGNARECSRRFIPTQLDTYFEVTAYELQEVLLEISAYDALEGFKGKQRQSMKTAMKIKSNQILGRYNHMVLEITARAEDNDGEFKFLYEGSSVGLLISLETNQHSGVETVTAYDEYNYITSPNYPHSYTTDRDTYIWHIESYWPLRVELVNMDLATFDGLGCPNDKLYIGRGQEIYESVTWPLCGLLTNYSQVFGGTSSLSKACCDVTVKFFIDRHVPRRNNSGFLIRYKKDFTEVGNKVEEKKSNPTGVAVGATIATMLLVMLCLASAAVVIMRFRQVQYEHRQRRRREGLRQAARERREHGEETAESTVFMLRSVVINTRAPPPPYPGPPTTQDGDNNNNNDEGRVNGSHGEGNGSIQGQTSPGREQSQAERTRGHNSNHTGGDGSADMEDPPPYHPLMSRRETTNQRAERVNDEPPAYEDSNPPRPPPTYGEATNS